MATAGALLLNNRIRVAEQLRLRKCRRRPASARRVAAERQRLVTLIEGVRFLDERRTLRPESHRSLGGAEPTLAERHLFGKICD